MKLLNASAALILLAAGSTMACTAVTTTGDGDGDGDNAFGTGGSTTGTGGDSGTATGGGVGTATGGGVGTGTGGGSTTAPKAHCAGGTTTQSAGAPSYANGWGAWEGTTDSCNSGAPDYCATESSVTFTSTSDEGALTLVLGAWSEDGRGCLNASGLTGFKFTASASGVTTVAANIAGTHDDYCETANCSAHPRVALNAVAGENTVTFSSLMPPEWEGVTAGANFNPAELTGLTWYVASGSTVTISNVEFY